MRERFRVGCVSPAPAPCDHSAEARASSESHSADDRKRFVFVRGVRFVNEPGRGCRNRLKGIESFPFACYPRTLECQLMVFPPGRVAQLVRAPASHAGGHRFESCRAHHSTSTTYKPSRGSEVGCFGFTLGFLWGVPATLGDRDSASTACRLACILMWPYRSTRQRHKRRVRRVESAFHVRCFAKIAPGGLERLRWLRGIVRPPFASGKQVVLSSVSPKRVVNHFACSVSTSKRSRSIGICLPVPAWVFAFRP